MRRFMNFVNVHDVQYLICLSRDRQPFQLKLAATNLHVMASVYNTLRDHRVRADRRMLHDLCGARWKKLFRDDPPFLAIVKEARANARGGV